MKSAQPEPSLPAVHVLHLATVVRACGRAGDQVIEQSGHTPEELTQPDVRIPFSRFVALVELSIQLSGEPGIGFLLGAQAPIARFGSVGFAALAAATLREAIEVMIRYMPTITAAFVYRLRSERGQAVLELEENVSLGAARETVVFGMSTCLWRLGEMLTGQTVIADVEFAFPKPAYFSRFGEGAPGACSFDCDAHRIRLDERFLDLPLLTADPAAARSARAQCERELAAITRSASLVDRVSDALWDTAEGVLTPAQLARRLGMAERTLKRRLAEHDTSYMQLLEQQRTQRACELLRTAASIEDIAERLGYSDASNFTRAFRRWTGKSPRAFRDGSNPSTD